MKILLHACCGPCSIYPTKKLSDDGQDFTIYFFNPNIQPYREFKHRLATLREYAALRKYALIVDKAYPLEQWVQGMLSEQVLRCNFCYRERLRYAAVYAVEHGYDAFTTTLLVSPFQRHELIKDTAERIAEEEGIPFYYEDFREGYEYGVTVSKELEMYRQGYCGCVFSERDRYEKRKKQTPEVSYAT